MQIQTHSDPAAVIGLTESPLKLPRPACAPPLNPGNTLDVLEVSSLQSTQSNPTHDSFILFPATEMTFRDSSRYLVNCYGSFHRQLHQSIPVGQEILLISAAVY